MKHVTASLAVSAGLLALAACADSASKVAGPANLQPSLSVNELADGPGSVSRHIMLTRAGYEAANAASRNAPKSSGTGIYYHGGPVLQSATNVVAVYWASSFIYPGGPNPATTPTGSGAADGSLVGFFLRNLGGSPYFRINSSYTDGSGTAIANKVSYTGFWANNTNAPSATSTASVSDAAMIAMLQSGFTSGALTYDASTLYAIFTAGTANLGGGFGTQYCAYHTHGTVSIHGISQTVLYAAMPYDNAYPTACTMQSYPNGDPGADAEVNTLAHETEETTTDMMANAWFDRRGYENADKCAWTFGTTYASGGYTANVNLGGKNWLVQQNWKNSGSGGCVMSWP